MTDPIRTLAEVLEAAARDVQLLPSGPWATEAEAMAAVTHAAKIAAAIRALASRIAAPDDEVMVQLVRRALAKSIGECDYFACDEAVEEMCECLRDARAVLAALREAGALR